MELLPSLMMRMMMLESVPPARRSSSATRATRAAQATESLPLRFRSPRPSAARARSRRRSRAQGRAVESGGGSARAKRTGRPWRRFRVGRIRGGGGARAVMGRVRPIRTGQSRTSKLLRARGGSRPKVREGARSRARVDPSRTRARARARERPCRLATRERAVRARPARSLRALPRAPAR